MKEINFNKIKAKLNEFKSKNTWKSLFVIPNETLGMNKFYLSIATVFGCGYFKYASGTIASILAAILGLILISFSHICLFIVLSILIVLGFISSDKSIRESSQDPSYIVIDEVVGQLIPFLIIGNLGFGINLLMAIIALIIFRLLDIYKPWIIGKSETTFKGGIAIMMDDILAGLFTLFIIFIVLLFV